MVLVYRQHADKSIFLCDRIDEGAEWHWGIDYGIKSVLGVISGLLTFEENRRASQCSKTSREGQSMVLSGFPPSQLLRLSLCFPESQ